MSKVILEIKFGTSFSQLCKMNLLVIFGGNFQERHYVISMTQHKIISNEMQIVFTQMYLIFSRCVCLCDSEIKQLFRIISFFLSGNPSNMLVLFHSAYS